MVTTHFISFKLIGGGKRLVNVAHITDIAPAYNEGSLVCLIEPSGSGTLHVTATYDEILKTLGHFGLVNEL